MNFSISFFPKLSLSKQQIPKKWLSVINNIPKYQDKKGIISKTELFCD